MFYYGLNTERNFLKELVGIEIDIPTEEVLKETIITLLQINECMEGAIFAVSEDCMYCGVVNPEDGEILIAKNEYDPDWFKELDGELRFCCYSIIEEIKQGVYKIIGC